MRFIDTNVFIYDSCDIEALKPHDISKESWEKIKGEWGKRKADASNIIDKVQNGEAIATSVVHISEVTNLLSTSNGQSGKQKAIDFTKNLYSKSNIRILGVSNIQYDNACSVAEKHNVKINDALAYVLMKDVLKIDSIYTFDREDFRKFTDIKIFP